MSSKRRVVIRKEGEKLVLPEPVEIILIDSIPDRSDKWGILTFMFTCCKCRDVKNVYQRNRKLARHLLLAAGWMEGVEAGMLICAKHHNEMPRPRMSRVPFALQTQTCCQEDCTEQFQIHCVRHEEAENAARDCGWRVFKHGPWYCPYHMNMGPR